MKWFFSCFVSARAQGDNSIFVGDVIASKAEKDFLIVCPHVKRLLCGSSFDGFYRSWNQCGLDFGHCPFRGKRARVKFRFDGYHVVELCLKLVGLPNEEV